MAYYVLVAPERRWPAGVEPPFWRAAVVLTDERRAVLESRVKACHPPAKVPPSSLRRTISAIFWRLTNGAKWRALPEEFGLWLMAVRTLACLAAVLAAPSVQAAGDPFEGVNRRIHDFNQQLRAHVLDPLAKTYVAVTPPPWREGIARAASNLGEPITAVNGLIAGKPALARNAISRFGINSTLGWGGVRDVAAERGLPHRPLPLADVACSRGLPSGPYLVVPLLGPSTLRDAGAMVVTSAALSQLVAAEWLAGVTIADGFVTYAARHEALRQVDAAALDSYAVLRSAYLQRRAVACAIDRARLLEQEAAEDSDAP
jgi:phospholipid-binding lipoprotein MlaA